MHTLFFPTHSLLTVTSATLERPGSRVPLVESPTSIEEHVVYECGAGTVELVVRSASPESVTVEPVRPRGAAPAVLGDLTVLELGARHVLSAQVHHAARTARWELRHRVGARYIFKTIEVRLHPLARL